MPVDRDLAFKAGKPCDRFDRGGFACAVGPEQDGDPPREHVEAQVIVGKQLAVAFRQSVYVKHGCNSFLYAA